MVQKGSVKTPIFSKLKALIIKYERDRDRQIRMIDNSGAFTELSLLKWFLLG